MVLERHESFVNLDLTASQQEAAHSILRTLAASSDKRVLFILNGFSGVGKSFLLENIKNGIALNNGRIIEPTAIEHEDKKLRDSSVHLVTTTILRELKVVQKGASKYYPEFTVVIHQLPGMNQEEVKNYLEKLPMKSESGLSTEQLIKYSLGIPLLAQQLVLRGVNEDIAARISARHLSENFLRGFYSSKALAEAAGSYLRMRIPQKALRLAVEMARELRPQHIYDYLNLVLQRRAELERRGTAEESPLFIAPESEKIYDKMLRSDWGLPSIDIFVPELSSADLSRLDQAIGSERASRVRMFGADYRKTGIWHKDSKGREGLRENETRVNALAKKYLEVYRTGRLSLPGGKVKQPASFLFHTTDHKHLIIQVTLKGWMVESLLQQRGIAYFVNNDVNEVSYIYNPDTKRIETLPKRVKFALDKTLAGF